MLSESTCFFLGNHNSPESVFPILSAAIEQHIREFNITSFVVGHYGHVDRMAARAVSELKKAYPFITLSVLLPYHPAERPFTLPPDFDDSIYPFELEHIPKILAIPRANRYMIKHCGFFITYCEDTTGNTFRFLQYAYGRAKQGLLHIEDLTTRVPNKTGPGQ